MVKNNITNQNPTVKYHQNSKYQFKSASIQEKTNDRNPVKIDNPVINNNYNNINFNNVNNNHGFKVNNNVPSLMQNNSNGFNTSFGSNRPSSKGSSKPFEKNAMKFSNKPVNLMNKNNNNNNNYNYGNNSKYDPTAPNLY